MRDVTNGFVTIAGAAANYGVVIKDGAIDAKATEQRRAGLAPSNEANSQGPERERWDAVFGASTMDRINRSLVALPGAVRQRRRTEMFQSVLSCLPDDFPRSGAGDAAMQMARDRLAAAADSF